LLQLDELNLKFCPQRKFKDGKIIFAQSPENLSLKFTGDYLDQLGARSSTTKSDVKGNYSWSRREVPELYSPINTKKAICERRLVILASESTESGKYKLIGQINLKLN
jgi:hypothetical protein